MLNHYNDTLHAMGHEYYVSKARGDSFGSLHESLDTVKILNLLTGTVVITMTKHEQSMPVSNVLTSYSVIYIR